MFSILMCLTLSGKGLMQPSYFALALDCLCVGGVLGSNRKEREKY